MLDNAYNKNSDGQNNRPLNGDHAQAGIDTPPDTAVVKGGEPPRFVAPSQTGVDILKLLTELEEIVEGTRRLPAGLMMRFDDEKFHYVIMKIRANLPEEMKRASRLARDSERIVEETRESADRVLAEAREAALRELEAGRRDADRRIEDALAQATKAREEAAAEGERIAAQARVKAEDIVAVAREQAELLVSDCEIVQRAQVVAQEIEERANCEAEAIRRGADDYAGELLANLENVLGKAISQVQAGQEMLR